MPIPAGIAKLLIRANIAQSIPSIRRIMGEGVHFLKYFSKRVLGSPNVELRATQALLNGAGAEVADLSLGAPWVPDNNKSIPVEIRAITNGYPPVLGLPELRHAVAECCQTNNRLVLNPLSEIMITSGVSQAIGLALDTFADSGDRIAMFDPTFFMYRLSVMNRGMRIQSIPTWTEQGITRFTERDMQRALRRARMLFLNTPSNPTGAIVPAETLERIAFYCKKWDVLIFSDEVYERFSYDHPHTSIGSLADARERTITANSLSKSHGLTSLRIGYIAGIQHLIQPMIVSSLASAPFVSELSQRVALLYLRDASARHSQLAEECRLRRDRIERTLHRAAVPYEHPSGAFYFWLRVSGVAKSGQEFAERLLREQNVLVMPGQSCGRRGNDFIRISYAGKAAELEKGISGLLQFLGRKSQSLDILPFRLGVESSEEKMPLRPAA